MPEIIGRHMSLFTVKEMTNIGTEAGFGYLCDLKLQIADTVLHMDWDVEKEFASETSCYHCVGKLSINRKNKSINIEKCRRMINSKPIYVNRQFKIFKLTSSEFIFKDISNEKLNRFYWFKLD